MAYIQPTGFRKYWYILVVNIGKSFKRNISPPLSRLDRPLVGISGLSAEERSAGGFDSAYGAGPPTADQLGLA